MVSRLSELIGWYGAAALLTGYALISFGTLNPRGFVYQLLVLTGSLGITVVSQHKRNVQPALLNAVSAVIAVLALGPLVLSGMR
jgi:hypothetical protein